MWATYDTVAGGRLVGMHPTEHAAVITAAHEVAHWSEQVARAMARQMPDAIAKATTALAAAHHDLQRATSALGAQTDDGHPTHPQTT